MYVFMQMQLKYDERYTQPQNGIICHFESIFIYSGQKIAKKEYGILSLGCYISIIEFINNLYFSVLIIL